MKSVTEFLRRIRAKGASARGTIFVTAVTAAVVMMLGVYLDRMNTAYHDRELYIRTENDVALVQTRIRGQINTDFAVLRNLANSIAIAPDKNHADFAIQIQTILSQNPHFASIAIAPDFVVRTIFPASEADRRVGTPVHPSPRDSKGGHADSRNDRYSTFFGPVPVDTGKRAFIALSPILIKRSGGRTVWGMVEATIDETRFYQVVGLPRARSAERVEWAQVFSGLSMAFRDISEPGIKKPAFFGDAEVFDQEPVTRRLSFPGGVWEIAAVPRDGWHVGAPNQLTLRTILVVAGGTIILSVYFTGLLLRERNANIGELKTRETSLLELSQRLELALDSSNIGIWELRDGDLYWDDRAAQLHGCPPVEGWHRLADWSAMVHPEDLSQGEAHFFNCAFLGSHYQTEYRISMPGGVERYLRSVGASFGTPGGIRTTGIVWDVTSDVQMARSLRQAKESSEIKNAELELAMAEISSREQQLEDLSSRLDMALDSYHCGTWEVDTRTQDATWDERMHQLYGLDYTTGHVDREQWLSCISPEEREEEAARTDANIEPGKTLSEINRVLLKDGTTRFIRSVGQIHTDRDGIVRISGIAFDVTEDILLNAALTAAKEEADAKNVQLEAAKSRIEHNSLHDPLTALANRRKLDLELDRLSRIAGSDRERFAILHIDLDRFKQINDTLGHAAGDAMLSHAAHVLSDCVGADDMVARIGGDEFVVLVKTAVTPDDIESLADDIVTKMHQPIDIDGFSSRCGVSIGIAGENGGDIDPRQMLINADIALYRAKKLGRNRYEFFTANLQAEIVSSKRIADQILAGLDNHEFTAWYQPQFSAETLALTGVEALVRWNHPTEGLLTPDRFLKIAEELNVVATLDRIVLETALLDKSRWELRGIHVPKISVNVSARRLHDEDLYETLARLPIAPGEVSFELVESIFLDEADDISSPNIERIKALGIDIEIDDFGTGHTSIVSLLKLKPKRLKIDRQLVKPILQSSQERALVRSIIDIARSLGVETVAEGVETMEHAVMLRTLGCDLLQGYAFSRPLSFEAFSGAASQSAWKMAC